MQLRIIRSMKITRNHAGLATMMGLMALNLWGCAAEVPSLIDQVQVPDNVMVGRVQAVITGERARRYQPEVRALMVEDRRTQERFNIHIESWDQQFVIALPPGDYLLNRVQIREGPFLSLADVAVAFSVGRGP